MKFVQNLCVDNLKRTLGIQFITLSSLAHTINFYRKLGFTHFEPKTGASAEDCKSITPYADHVAKLKFKNGTELLLDKEMSGFIRLLLKHKLDLGKTQHARNRRIDAARISNGVQSRLKKIGSVQNFFFAKEKININHSHAF